MLLQDFPGQESIKAYFKKVVSEDRLPHAILMVGQPGFGPLGLALGLSTLLQCKEPIDFEACGTCSSCSKSLQYIHPDIHFAFPVVKMDKIKREDTISNHFLPEWRSFLQANSFGNLNDWLNHIGASDKVSNINVAECNSIIKNLGLKTYEGKYKVQIIWHAESLRKEGNRLLKLIEEPSPDTIIIMICSNRTAILNTIRSRCQIISIPPIDDEKIGMHLQNHFTLEESESEEIKYLASGNMRKAMQLAAQNQMNYSEDMLAWFRFAYKADPEDLTKWTDYLVGKSKQDLKNFMGYTLHFLREYLLGLNLRETNRLRLSQDEKNVILKMQKIINRQKTALLERLFSKNIGYIDRNLSIKILIMNMSFEINEILRSEVNKFV
ncbi:MAG: hypothetical protein HKN51_12815 [Saprospiraceae bacterium]|nr:hypothetical protein [Bacteroidia bacterium]NNE15857.1 hypothetical protein [Saprospiraceae bacterium]